MKERKGIWAKLKRKRTNVGISRRKWKLLALRVWQQGGAALLPFCLL